MKHTSGPWTYAEDHGLHVRCGISIYAEEDMIARVEKVEDARLIVAAPVMARTLRNVLTHFDFVGEEDLGIAGEVRALLADIDKED